MGISFNIFYYEGAYNIGSSPGLPTVFNADIFIYYWEKFANDYGQTNWESASAPDWTAWMGV
ncbi:MAG: hypothetical protein M1496_02590 [Candidatus Thermoplasmatota archaeon]|nr:hypothetical protein [Candidatus Thermoplasmatota archaeon]